MRNLQNQHQTEKQNVFEFPVPLSLLPFLDEKKVNYTRTNERSMLEDVVKIKMEIKDPIELTKLVYAVIESVHKAKFNETIHNYFRSPLTAVR